tara:strand:- start:1383 stop:2063 length:681 start_codon:yes stop_codon:yes gene_type:complete
MPTVAIGDVAANILGAALPSTASAPILARRKGVERKVDEAKHEERETVALAKAKKLVAEQGHTTLRVKSDAPAASVDPVLETMLRKTATRGVVSLFNAVREAQKEVKQEGKLSKQQKRRRVGDSAADASGAAASTSTPAADISKESFLDILRRGTAPPKAPRGKGDTGAAAAAAASTAPSYLRDDYMIGRKSKVKHWDVDVEDDLADVDDEADQVDSDKDFADEDY